MSVKEANDVKKDIQSALNGLNSHQKYNKGIAKASKEKLSHMQDTITEAGSIHAEVKSRLVFNLNFCNKILDIYFAKSRS